MDAGSGHAGIQEKQPLSVHLWIPAFAGMTIV
jgi:hypothetical protein